MSEHFLQQKFNSTLEKPIYLFWFLQLCFWSFVSLISLVSLTLWYVQIDVAHLNHTFWQSVVGIVFSLPLYWVFMKCWNSPIFIRALISIVSVICISFIWTLIRVELYIEMIGTDGHWDEFGGWYFSSIFIFFCWTGFFHGIRYYQLLQFEHKMLLSKAAEAKEEQLKRVNAQSVARDAKIKMLRYQLNPHFLFNTLNAISTLILIEENKTANTMVTKLSEFLRYSLDKDPMKKVTLESEIQALQLYLAIEKVRFEDRLHLDFQINDNCQQALVPSMILQPLAENSIKHAIAVQEQGGSITISVNRFADDLLIEVADNGPGADIIDGNLHRESGVGLSNTRERLQALYNEKFSLVVSHNQPSGVKVNIRMPFQQG